MKTKQQGFTLIELVVVIVILGILAATAVPRFAGVSDDARAAVADGVVGTILSSAAIQFASTRAANTFEVIANATDISSNDDVVVATSGTDNGPVYIFDGAQQTVSAANIKCDDPGGATTITVSVCPAGSASAADCVTNGQSASGILRDSLCDG